MPTDRLIRVVLAVAAIGAAAAAAILLNLALLGYAQPRNDPVGKLNPRALLSPGTAPVRRMTTTERQRHELDHDD